jgi:hypothetical protein
MKNIAIFVLTIFFLPNSFASSIHNVKRLYFDLMKDYNENVYPANDQTQDINISVSMSALQLVDLDSFQRHLKFDNFVVADFNGMNTGRCIKQAPYTMLMIHVRSHVFILTYKIHFRRMVIFRSKCDRACLCIIWIHCDINLTRSTK